MPELEIAAWECGNCLIAIQLSLYTTEGVLKIRLEELRCPLCGNQNLIPLTAKMLFEVYEAGIDE